MCTSKLKIYSDSFDADLYFLLTAKLNHSASISHSFLSFPSGHEGNVSVICCCCIHGEYSVASALPLSHFINIPHNVSAETMTTNYAFLFGDPVLGGPSEHRSQGLAHFNKGKSKWKLNIC